MAIRNIHLLDLAKGIDSEKLGLNNPITVPNNEFRELLDLVIERGSLESVSQREKFFLSEKAVPPQIAWLKIRRLPVRPDNVEDYDLFNRWQGVLSSLHEWGYRVYFLLRRHEGKTGLYIGVCSAQGTINSKNAIEQVMEATSGSMPGIELKQLDAVEITTDITATMMSYSNIGAVTGLPSFSSEDHPGVLQTLDPLAFGIRDTRNEERNYSLLVIADPIGDREISDIMNRMRTLGSQIHSMVERGVSETENESEGKQLGLNQYSISGIAGALSAVFGNPIFGLIGSIAGVGLGNLNKTITNSKGLTVNTTYLDKFAQYAEQLTDFHIERMKQGRNLGYWNVGTYVLANDRKDVLTVNGMLRSIYAGKESYVEPIRLHLLKETSNAREIVRNNYTLIPLFDPEAEGMTEENEWHIFGKRYQYLSTPMTTKEFALTTSLPRCDAPGLRFVKTAVRFANNPPVVGDSAIRLGSVVNMGVEQNERYSIDHNDLVRHSLVVGSTGSGKSCTCKRILTELLKKDVPALIIEPAKDDYVRWAIKMNKTLPPEKQFRIYMPGFDEYEGVKLDKLELCPFEPATVPGAKVDLMAHCENLISLLNASLPSEDILPVLIDETVYSLYDLAYPKIFSAGGMMPQQEFYPLLSTLTPMSKKVLDRKGYEEKVKSNLTACLETRFQYLVRGTRGKLLNVMRSTDFGELFDRPAVINISGISAQRDKALIMSVLMLALYEYKRSKYLEDAEYRKKAAEDRLLHLTLVEEAHNILLKPEGGSTNNPQRVVAELFTNILSEIRSYGEGMMIVDQYPSRLIPDAIKNTNYKIIHRLVAPDDQDMMASSAALRPEQKALIASLSPGNAIVYGDRDDAAVWVHMKKTDV